MLVVVVVVSTGRLSFVGGVVVARTDEMQYDGFCGKIVGTDVSIEAESFAKCSEHTYAACCETGCPLCL